MIKSNSHLAFKTIQNQTVICQGETLTFQVSQYNNQRPAILLICEDGIPYSKLTVNFPEIPLSNDEIVVKTTGENANLVKILIGSNLFRDTNRKVSSGYSEYSIWEIIQRE